MREDWACSEAGYTWAQAEVRQLIGAEPHRGTPEGDRLDPLASLIAASEANCGAEDLSDIEYC
jgi:antitoxin component HigA of HigAB toxin-antitoxin module